MTDILNPKELEKHGAAFSRHGSTKMCDRTGCNEPARFQVGFVAPFKKIILMPGHQVFKNKEAVQIWSGIGVCGGCRPLINEIKQIYPEEQMNKQNAAQAARGKPTLDFNRGYLIFGEIRDEKFVQVTRVDGKVLDARSGGVKK